MEATESKTCGICGHVYADPILHRLTPDHMAAVAARADEFSTPEYHSGHDVANAWVNKYRS